MGPGHGGPGPVAAAWLEGTYSEVYPAIGRDLDGMRRLFRQFSFPGGIPSHVAPETPGSIHEGGELGYALSHAYGAAFDNPDLVVAAVVGDGEAETGPLAASWHSTKFVDPRRDGAVLPILHLNGYKIANPTVLARIPEDELLALMSGYGHTPYVVSGSDPAEMHQAFAATLDHCLDEIADIQHEARGQKKGRVAVRRPWPMIVLRSPKGWTGPKELDGHRVEGSWRSHQVPFADARPDPAHRKVLEDWMRSYKPEELFDDVRGARRGDRGPAPGRRAADERQPARQRRPPAQGPRPARLHRLRRQVEEPGTGAVESTRVLGRFLRDVMARNGETFRLFAPDENSSNRLQDVMEVTDRTWNAETLPDDDHLAVDGRIMEILSEHTCEGWLEGYLLTGRHGLFSCYEAFIHVVDSMFNQHAKWLRTTNQIPWRRPVASLNYLLTSHVWRQDHNGFSHQDPGFIDHVVNKKADVIRVYLPPTPTRCCRWPTTACAASSTSTSSWPASSRRRSTSRWTRRSSTPPRASASGSGPAPTGDQEPDVVIGCAGDVPTMEALAAVMILRDAFPDLRIRFVNVVDLMRLQDHAEHSHGLSDADFDALFTRDKPVIFAYHGYPWLIHRLTYRRTNHGNFHVRGYKEEGTTTTPFDMTVINQIDRFDLAMDVIDRVPRLQGDQRPGARAVEEQAHRAPALRADRGRGPAGDPRVAVGVGTRTRGRHRGRAPPHARRLARRPRVPVGRAATVSRWSSSERQRASSRPAEPGRSRRRSLRDLLDHRWVETC